MRLHRHRAAGLHCMPLSANSGPGGGPLPVGTVVPVPVVYAPAGKPPVAGVAPVYQQYPAQQYPGQQQPMPAYLQHAQGAPVYPVVPGQAYAPHPGYPMQLSLDQAGGYYAPVPVHPPQPSQSPQPSALVSQPTGDSHVTSVSGHQQQQQQQPPQLPPPQQQPPQLPGN